MSVPITCIGEITETPKDIIVLDSSNKKMKIKNSGYRHF
jgi:thiamine monophosphate kinase